MRKLVLMVPVLCLILLAQIAEAQVVGVGANEHAQTSKEKAEAASKIALEKILKYAQNLNYESMGRMSVYAGREPNRCMKVKVNMMDSYERLDNETTCNIIHKVLDKTVIWNATNFKVVSSVNEKFYYWDVEFTDEKTKTKVYTMLFVELGGEMLFARFDKKGTIQ